jgi:SAM-dependent methyltransferase
MDAEAFRRFERETHDGLAATYGDFFAGVTSAMIAPLLDAAHVTRSARVLDVACGPGHLAAAAAARGARASAVDLSPQMVTLAARNHPAVDVRQGDAEALPFGDATFDAVVCAFGLGHFPRPEVAASELARVLVAGGRLAVSWWDLPRSRINGTFLDAVASAGVPPPPGVPPGPPVTRFSDEGALRALLTGAGLVDVGVTTHTWTHRAASLDAWWHGGLGGMARVTAAVRTQAPDVQHQIRGAFERLAAPYARDGGYEIPNAAKLAVGTKR